MNYLDEYYQSGVMGLNYLKDVNVGSMIMEPLRGGRLVNNIPTEVQNLWDKSEVKRTPVEWALQYLWNRDDVDCVLSGMTSLEQVKDNIRIASTEDIISENDQEVIREVARTYRTFLGNSCTRCGYCMPCPADIEINNCARMSLMLRRAPSGDWLTDYWQAEIRKIENCLNCGQCRSRCPYELNIPELLKRNYEDYQNVLDGKTKV